MLNADTITDEQIRELWALALDTGSRELARDAQVALGEWYGAHRYSPMVEPQSECSECAERPAHHLHVQAGRARCAEILNARAAAAVNVMDGGTGWPPDDRTPAQVEADKARAAMPAMSCGCPIDAHSDTVNIGMGPSNGATCVRGWPVLKL